MGIRPPVWPRAYVGPAAPAAGRSTSGTRYAATVRSLVGLVLGRTPRGRRRAPRSRFRLRGLRRGALVLRLGFAPNEPPQSHQGGLGHTFNRLIASQYLSLLLFKS